GADPARFLELVFGPYAEDTDHPWHRLERGEIPLAEAREAIIALGAAEGVDTDPFHLFARMGRSGAGAREPLVARTRALREAGLRTALVTNNAREFREAWERLLPPLPELFDAVVDSSEVGARKPAAAIFEIALERVGGPPPGRVLFLDDFEGNVRAAQSLGMRALRVDADPTDALAALDAILAARRGA
ncbi:MAG: HAD-IA family hydrolase, partial [Myxococcota bacterium]|nr:HAD-IA family hydrolase [Myxococcota bacterium]